jgi:hypothetical protein
MAALRARDHSVLLRQPRLQASGSRLKPSLSLVTGERAAGFANVDASSDGVWVRDGGAAVVAAARR